VKVFGIAIFSQSRAYTVSERILGAFALPNLLPSKNDKTSSDLIECTAAAWDDLAESTNYGTMPFDNIHSLLFFLELLRIGRQLLFRGQADSQWGLQTTLTRKLNQYWDPITIRKAKRSFVNAVHELPDRRHIKLLENEEEALCQHYGFPTHLLDFTWSQDIAAFFALGGFEAYERGFRPHDKIEMGSFWVIDTMGRYANGIQIASLGRGFMRPALQRGEFLRLTDDPAILVSKFLFRHDPDGWADSLDDLGPTSVTSFASYLMPARDPVADTSKPYLDELEKQNGRK